MRAWRQIGPVCHRQCVKHTGDTDGSQAACSVPPKIQMKIGGAAASPMSLPAFDHLDVSLLRTVIRAFTGATQYTRLR